MTTLSDLIRNARPPTPEELRAQLRSFAYGNAKLANPKVTREMVDRAADRMEADDAELLAAVADLPPAPKEGDLVSVDDALDRMLADRPAEKRASREADAAALAAGTVTREELSRRNALVRAEWFVPDLDSFGKAK